MAASSWRRLLASRLVVHFIGFRPLPYTVNLVPIRLDLPRKQNRIDKSNSKHCNGPFQLRPLTLSVTIPPYHLHSIVSPPSCIYLPVSSCSLPDLWTAFRLCLLARSPSDTVAYQDLSQWIFLWEDPDELQTLPLCPIPLWFVDQGARYLPLSLLCCVTFADWRPVNAHWP